MTTNSMRAEGPPSARLARRLPREGGGKCFNPCLTSPLTGEVGAKRRVGVGRNPVPPA
jgi:hypothetical protein